MTNSYKPDEIPNFSGQQRQEKRSLFEGWYRLTAPPREGPKSTSKERDVARRGRLASIILLLLTFFSLLVAPLVFSMGNPFSTITHIISIVSNITALFLNRRGKVAGAGIVVVISITLSLTSTMVAPGAKINATNLFTLDLLVLPELITVSLLPVYYVFVDAIFNSIFVVICLFFLPYSADLQQLLRGSSQRIIFPLPIILFILVAIVAFLWVRSATEALQRADQAEEIIRLEQRERERQQQEITQKRELDHGVQQILHTHIQIANGHFDARAPLNQDNVLWQVAFSLNNLLARMQGYGQLDIEMKRAKMQATELVDQVQTAKYRQTFMHMQRRDTFLDELAKELNHTCVIVPRQSPINKSDGRSPSTDPSNR